MTKHTPAFEVFYDGDCPLCRREIDLLRRLNSRGLITFTDISSTAFSTERLGLTRHQLMERIHGRHVDGNIVEGVDVFRALYARTPLAFLVPVSRLPGIRWLLDAGYTWFARNRLRLTGRCSSGTCSVTSV